MESLAYSYNVKGQLTGINKDYALKNNYNKWNNYFGLYLGYDDNPGNLFSHALLTGQLSGQVWNTQGDDAQRKYDNEYDNAGRLIKAGFNEKKELTESWTNTNMNFSTGGTGPDGSITYDLNGNLLSLFRYGVSIGQPGGVKLDDLTYTYKQFSNKLAKVADNPAAGFTNGSQGDFKDGANATDDYVYDENGNLIIDLNKNIGTQLPPQGSGGAITYNYLDKPEEILISDKGTVKIVYDADGNKLQRSFTSLTQRVKTTTYINQFTYEEVTGGDGPLPLGLAGISFEEGRIRVIKPLTQSNGLDMLTISGSGISLPGGAEGVYDYYITDQQTNVRMILTEEMHSSFSTCSMENINLERALLEAGIFGQVNTDGSISPAFNEVEATRYPQIAVPGQIPVPGWQSNTTQVSRLGNWAGHTVGPNQLLKVMAGDEISATAKYYFETPNNPSGQSDNNFITGLLAMLAGTLTNSVLPAHGAETAISSQLQGAQPFTSLITPASDPSYPLNPKAGLVMVFFDERFNYIGEGSFFDAVKTPGDNALLLGTDYLYTKAPKNGYCYIYVCNQSNENVYFDDLKVRHDRARIIEENHYYAYGLKIAAISSQKLADKAEGIIKNNFGYQGDYSEFDEETGWNDFELRSYDPQIGRFIQADPYDQFASGYVGMGNDPVNMVDPSGGGISETGLYDVVISGIMGGSKGMAAARALTSVITVGSIVMHNYSNGNGGSMFPSDGQFKGNSFTDKDGSKWTYENTTSEQITRTEILQQSIDFGTEGVPGPATYYHTNPSDFNGNVSRAIAAKFEAAAYRAYKKANPYEPSNQGEIREQDFNRDRSDFETQLSQSAPVQIMSQEMVGAALFTRAAKPASRVFEVGTYNSLRGAEVGLQAHHVGQGALMKRFIKGYNYSTAPSILVPELGHTLGEGIISTSTRGFTKARQVLARDIFELRRVYPNVPNSSLEQLIKLNKTMYPGAFIK